MISSEGSVGKISIRRIFKVCEYRNSRVVRVSGTRRLAQNSVTVRSRGRSGEGSRLWAARMNAAIRESSWMAPAPYALG